MVHEPGLGSDASAVADEDGTALVLVGFVDGTGDKVDGLVDVGAGDDEALGVNDEVVSEERQSIATRLTATGLIVGVNEDIMDLRIAYKV